MLRVGHTLDSLYDVTTTKIEVAQYKTSKKKKKKKKNSNKKLPQDRCYKVLVLYKFHSGIK